MCFSSVLCVCVFFFWCLEERETCRETRQKAENQEKKKKSLLLSGLRGAWGYL